MAEYGVWPDRTYWHDAYEQRTGAAGLAWNYSTPLIERSVATHRHRTGHSNPGYRKAIARGANATTSFGASVITYDNKPTRIWFLGNTSATNPTFVNGYRRVFLQWDNGISSVPVLPPASFEQNASNLAAASFHNALSKQQNLIQGGVIAGEALKTLKMIANPAKALRTRIGGYLDSLKKGRRGSPASKKRFLADTYLEHAYGWTPLLHDLDDARSYLRKRRQQVFLELYKVNATGRDVDISFVDQGWVTGTVKAHSTIRTVRRSDVYLHGAVKSQAWKEQMVTASSMGLHPNNFAPTVWELLPWSFVIDYFSNIGDVITAYSQRNCDFAWGSRTTVNQAFHRASFIPESPTSWPFTGYVWEHFVSQGGGEIVNKQVTRTPIYSVPLPSISFEMPGFGKKWLNMAALLSARSSLTPF